MALNSMTGFARESGESGGWTWSWELKSVNAKGLDVRLRVPMGFDGLEPAARTAISGAFSRGNITAGMSLGRASAGTSYRINESHLTSLIDMSLELAGKYPGLGLPTAGELLGLRGVIDADDEGVGDDERELLEVAMLKTLKSACAQLAAARAEEGARLQENLDGFLSTLGTLLKQASACAESQTEAIRTRLHEQIKLLVSDVSALDPARLEQEAALVMTKADIREELDRLAAHLASAQEMLAGGGAIGRRLDFLCQELNREANTICSKAHQTELTRVGLDMKAAIEQFREQVQNIE